MENIIPNNDPARKTEIRSEELDAKELIRKHIEDPNHEITDDDIRNLKPATNDDPPSIGAEAMSRILEMEETDDDDNDDDDDDDENDAEIETDIDNEDNKESAKPTTPWDVRSE
jgi:hypothetical protein